MSPAATTCGDVIAAQISTSHARITSRKMVVAINTRPPNHPHTPVTSRKFNNGTVAQNYLPKRLLGVPPPCKPGRPPAPIWGIAGKFWGKPCGREIPWERSCFCSSARSRFAGGVPDNAGSRGNPGSPVFGGKLFAWGGGCEDKRAARRLGSIGGIEAGIPACGGGCGAPMPGSS